MVGHDCPKAVSCYSAHDVPFRAAEALHNSGTALSYQAQDGLPRRPMSLPSRFFLLQAAGGEGPRYHHTVKPTCTLPYVYVDRWHTFSPFSAFSSLARGGGTLPPATPKALCYSLATTPCPLCPCFFFLHHVVWSACLPLSTFSFRVFFLILFLSRSWPTLWRLLSATSGPFGLLPRMMEALS